MNTVSKLKFIKDIIKREVVNTATREIFNNIEVVIKIKNIENGKSRIHRMTDVLSQYRNNKPKYVADIADDIVLFLNYIYFELNKNELSNIQYLTFDIGAKFLENYSIGKTEKTVLKMERNITKLYYFLACNAMLVNINKNDFVVTTTKFNKISIQSAFDGRYKRFSIKKANPIHDFEPELLMLFFDKVKEVSPQILLGVYMQCFGGLRVSEVISLSYSNLSVKGTNARNGMVVNIKATDLRPDLKSSGITQAKKPRKQTVIGVPCLIEEIYTEHIKNYKSSLTNAIFLNKNGEALTPQMYRYYFNKAKKSFIESLINSNDMILKSKGIFLQSQYWSTHIGRGLFSNMISKFADNIVEIATWRGDSNLDSSLSYISDHLKVEEKIIALMNEYYLKHLSKTQK